MTIAATHFYLKNRSAIFDWLVLGISFSLGFIFPSINDFIISSGFYNWILSALLLYSIGAILKEFPLSYRLSKLKNVEKEISYKIILIIGHFIIILMAANVVKPAIIRLFNLPSLWNENQEVWQLIAIAISLFITWIVYRNKFKRKFRRVYNINFLFSVEFIADIFLIAGASIFSFIFWEKGVLEMLSRTPTDSIGGIIFLFIFLSILFVFYYLPLRYLFFIEDREGGKNWRRLTYIFGFILLRALFEMLSL